MRYMIWCSISPKGFYISRFSTMEEARQAAKELCVKTGGYVEIFERITRFDPVAREKSEEGSTS